MLYILNASNPEQPVTGGEYNITAFLNGGTAVVEVKKDGSDNWANIGDLPDALEMRINLPLASTVRLTPTGGAVVEISS